MHSCIHAQIQILYIESEKNCCTMSSVQNIRDVSLSKNGNFQPPVLVLTQFAASSTPGSSRVIRWLANNHKVPCCHGNKNKSTFKKTFPLYFIFATKVPADIISLTRVRVLMGTRLEVSCFKRRVVHEVPVLETHALTTAVHEKGFTSMGVATSTGTLKAIIHQII